MDVCPAGRFLFVAGQEIENDDNNKKEEGKKKKRKREEILVDPFSWRISFSRLVDGREFRLVIFYSCRAHTWLYSLYHNQRVGALPKK